MTTPLDSTNSVSRSDSASNDVQNPANLSSQSAFESALDGGEVAATSSDTGETVKEGFEKSVFTMMRQRMKELGEERKAQQDKEVARSEEIQKGGG